VKVLVTGGKGFIGRNLVNRLKDKYSVTVMDYADGPDGDIRNYKIVEKAAERCKYIFHLAAISNIFDVQKNPTMSSEINIGGTVNVLEAAKRVGAKVIFISSAAVYGKQDKEPLTELMQPNPVNLYGMQKYFGERYCRMLYDLHGVESVCLRYFNVFGPGQTNDSVIYNFLRAKYEKRPLKINGKGNQIRSFVYIDDVADATVRAAESRVKSAEAINIATEKTHSVLDVARLIGGRIEFGPPVAGDIASSVPDITKAKALLNWKPKTPFEDGLKKTEGFFVKNLSGSHAH